MRSPHRVETVPPLLYLGYFQPVTSRCISRGRLFLEEAEHQCCATLGRPALYLLRVLFVCHLPPCILEPQVSDKKRLGRVSSIATRLSEAAGEQDAARPIIRSKARTIDGAAARRRARVKLQGGLTAPVATKRRTKMGGVNAAI
jgi:hypothetical protein